MADQYGSLCSNAVAVRDQDAFTQLITSVSWGGDTPEVWVVTQGDWCQRPPHPDGGILLRFGMEGVQYPSAIPDAKEDLWDETTAAGEEPSFELNDWVALVRRQLLAGEVLHVVAGGNESLRYVSFTELIIFADSNEYVARRVSSNADTQSLLNALKEA